MKEKKDDEREGKIKKETGKLNLTAAITASFTPVCCDSEKSLWTFASLIVCI